MNILTTSEHKAGPRVVRVEDLVLPSSLGIAHEELSAAVVACETEYINVLESIAEVFQRRLEEIKLVSDEDLEVLFGNVDALLDLTRTLITQVDEDRVPTAASTERDDHGEGPADDRGAGSVGECFRSLGLEREFDVYIDYARCYPDALVALDRLCREEIVMAKIATGPACPGPRPGVCLPEGRDPKCHVCFSRALRHALPTLLFEPLRHFAHYVILLQVLIRT